MENPEQIIRSWALQGNYSNGDVIQDKLVPEPFGRIRTPFVNTWRREQVSSILDFGANGFSYFLPESLRVVSSIFLRVDLPALAQGNYKEIPGLYFFERQRFLTNGSESYFVDPGLFYRDYIESLTDEEAKVFCTTYLGYTVDGGNGAARTLMLPILLPNSTYLYRHGRKSHGHGIWPAYLGSTRLEVQLSIKAGEELCAAGGNPPQSISGLISMMTHVCQMTPEDTLEYSNHRGKYSVHTRRFTEITNGWTAATANTRAKLTHNQPQGNITEIKVIAVPAAGAAHDREIQDLVRCSFISVTADTIVQKMLDDPVKVNIELWSNGFVGNSLVSCPTRLCFAAHAAEAENMWSGAFNAYNVSQLDVDVEFAEDVVFKVYAVQLETCSLDPAGNIIASIR